MDDYNIYFNEYNAQSKKVIDRYGDKKITRAYLITTPITNFTLLILNIITMQNCKDVIRSTMHMQLLVEIVINKRRKKMILIDKSNCINILTDFHINDTSTIHKIKIKNKTSLRGILDKTRDRIGETHFFNWHIYKNNCHYFINKLISIINCEFKCRCIKSPKKFKHLFNIMFLNTFSMHLYHVCMFLYNFVQKYIINVKYHILSNLEKIIKFVMEKMCRT